MTLKTDKIPLPNPEIYNEQATLDAICKRLELVVNKPADFTWTGYYSHIEWEGPLTSTIVSVLEKKGYTVLPHYNEGINIKNWFVYMESIYLWTIWW